MRYVEDGLSKACWCLWHSTPPIRFTHVTHRVCNSWQGKSAKHPSPPYSSPASILLLPVACATSRLLGLHHGTHHGLRSVRSRPLDNGLCYSTFMQVVDGLFEVFDRVCFAEFVDRKVTLLMKVHEFRNKLKIKLSVLEE